MNITPSLLKVAKAIAAAVLPFVTIWIQTSVIDGRAVVAAVVTAVVVFLVPNKQTA